MSNICTYPLALSVTRSQIQQQRAKAATSHGSGDRSLIDVIVEIYEDGHGLSGFTVGLLPDTMKTIADSFLFFLVYDSLRRSRTRNRKAKSAHLSAIDELGIGFLAGAFCKFLTSPLANVVTRKQTSHVPSNHRQNSKIEKESLRAIALEIKREKGIRGFWSGYTASLILTLNPSLTFFFFESLKLSLLPRNKRSDPSPRQIFFLAAVSKALASIITYPFSLAKSRAQSKRSGSHGTLPDSNSPSTHNTLDQQSQSNVFSIIMNIARTDGPGALYKGLSGEVLKGFFSHGITMLIKESIHKLILQLFYAILKMLKKYPDPSELARLATQRAEKAASDYSHRVERALVAK